MSALPAELRQEILADLDLARRRVALRRRHESLSFWLAQYAEHVGALVAAEAAGRARAARLETELALALGRAEELEGWLRDAEARVRAAHEPAAPG